MLAIGTQALVRVATTRARFCLRQQCCSCHFSASASAAAASASGSDCIQYTVLFTATLPTPRHARTTASSMHAARCIEPAHCE
jgi:hypothetical protein